MWDCIPVTSTCVGFHISPLVRWKTRHRNDRAMSIYPQNNLIMSHETFPVGRNPSNAAWNWSTAKVFYSRNWSPNYTSKRPIQKSQKSTVTPPLRTPLVPPLDPSAFLPLIDFLAAGCNLRQTELGTLRIRPLRSYFTLSRWAQQQQQQRTW